jgi:hypothetical protein
MSYYPSAIEGPDYYVDPDAEDLNPDEDVCPHGVSFCDECEECEEEDEE